MLLNAQDGLIHQMVSYNFPRDDNLPKLRFGNVQRNDLKAMAGAFKGLAFGGIVERDYRGVQVKGARRWGHSLQTTLNRADQTNALRPLLLHFWRINTGHIDARARAGRGGEAQGAHSHRADPA